MSDTEENISIEITEQHKEDDKKNKGETKWKKH